MSNKEIKDPKDIPIRGDSASIAKELISGFDLDKVLLRPTQVELVVIGLITTLSEYGLLDKAIENIEDNTDLRFDGDTDAIKTVARAPYVPFIFDKPRTIGLYLHVYPHTLVKDTYTEIPAHNMTVRSARTSMRYINAANLGFKCFWLPNRSGIGVLSYDSEYNLRQLIEKHKIPLHVQDKFYA